MLKQEVLNLKPAKATKIKFNFNTQRMQANSLHALCILEYKLIMISYQFKQYGRIEF